MVVWENPPDSRHLVRLSVLVRSERAETTPLDIWHMANVNYVYVTITSFTIGVLCDRYITIMEKEKKKDMAYKMHRISPKL